MPGTKIINKLLYQRFTKEAQKQTPIQGLQLHVEYHPKRILLSAPLHGGQISVFSDTKQSIRYIPYTLDSFMAQIILIFGYRSSVHIYIENLLKDQIDARELLSKYYQI